MQDQSVPMARAISSNDVAQLVWYYPKRINGCLGFAVFRRKGRDATAAWEALPSWVGFAGQPNLSWLPKPTTVWPVQKMAWRDLTATPGETYQYKILPLTGPADAQGHLTALEDLALLTEPVTLTPKRGAFSAYFNRGILSTQFLTHQIPAGSGGEPNFKVLRDRIAQPGDPLRASLAGQLIEGLTQLLKRAAAQGGVCYLALYELTDPELLQLLLQAPKLHVILCNTSPGDTENQPARRALHEAGRGKPEWEVIDRFVPSGHIGHNKFCVYVAADGAAQAVLLGSTNWTETALCAQSNNALVANHTQLAQAYLDYWHRLKADTPDAGTAKQSAVLRSSNQKPGADAVAVDDGQATVWFSPNTDHARASQAGTDEAVPIDLQSVFGLMNQAKQAILFLEFQPGHPSVVDMAASIGNAKPDLFIRGAVTDPGAVDTFNTTLFHRTGDAVVSVVAASALNDPFGSFQKELLKAGPMAHAIIHDKVVVIDPMSPDCVVVTGSHNHGYRASYNNDENLLIVKGHRELAQAYVTHVMDIYDHYRFRYMVQKNGAAAYAALDSTDTWQAKYFGAGSAKSDVHWWWPSSQSAHG